MAESVHFIAGGLAGATSAIVTSPLEVLKTRLQSTIGQRVVCHTLPQMITTGNVIALQDSAAITLLQKWSLLKHYIGHIAKSEGVKAFYKGLAPSLMGIMPTRAIYFYTYNKAKNGFNTIMTPNTHQVHLVSAFCGGVVGSTCMNPIFVVKTRLQLDQSKMGSNLTSLSCIRQIIQQEGMRGFYRGLTASYAGVMETGLCFVLYESTKQSLLGKKPYSNGKLDFMDYILAATSSKMIATTVCYPHEVARTRMRQLDVLNVGRKYKSFVQTVMTVWREEGRKGLYGGMSAHLMRVIPNTAILFLTYETVVHLLDRQSY